MKHSIPFVLATIFSTPHLSIARAQDDAPPPPAPPAIVQSATTAKGFVPPGWELEETVEGDLNGDSVGDLVLKLLKPEKPEADEADDQAGSRLLVIAMGAPNGPFTLAAVAPDVLQCTQCGGAFYGAMPAPANIAIERGVIVISQDHGSREVTEQTLRFRYEPASRRFALIGADFDFRDRATGTSASESTNYLTGARVTTKGAKSRPKTVKTAVKLEPVYIEDANYMDLETAAGMRANPE